MEITFGSLPQPAISFPVNVYVWHESRNRRSSLRRQRSTAHGGGYHDQLVRLKYEIRYTRRDDIGVYFDVSRFLWETKADASARRRNGFRASYIALAPLREYRFLSRSLPPPAPFSPSSIPRKFLLSVKIIPIIGLVRSFFKVKFLTSLCSLFLCLTAFNQFRFLICIRESKERN